jgi:hypothetical protein
MPGTVIPTLFRLLDDLLYKSASELREYLNGI